MPLSMRLTQLATRIGTEGSYNAAVEAAANAKLLLFDARFAIDQDMHQRSPMRSTFGSLSDVAGKRMARITFSTELKGQGVAGVSPAYGVPLRCCGHSETLSTGTAIVGTVTADPKNLTVAQLPTVAGTFVGPRNGQLVITIETVTTNVSIAIRAQFFPSAGTAFYETETKTQAAAAAVSLTGTQLTGVTFDFGDPSVSTAGYQIGDRFYIPLTSTASVQALYRPISGAAIPVMDMALYQDGRIFKIHSARGNMRIRAENGKPVMMEYEFMGVPQAIVDGAILTGIAYDNVAPPPFKGVTFTLHGVTPECFTNFSLDLGNTIAMRECATATHGYEAARITARRVTGELDPEGTTIADFDAWNKFLNATTGTMTSQVGSTAGNIVEVNGTRVQIVNVTDQDRNLDRVDRLNLLYAEAEYDPGGLYHEHEIIVR